MGGLLCLDDDSATGVDLDHVGDVFVRGRTAEGAGPKDDIRILGIANGDRTCPAVAVCIPNDLAGEKSLRLTGPLLAVHNEYLLHNQRIFCVVPEPHPAGICLSREE